MKRPQFGSTTCLNGEVEHGVGREGRADSTHSSHSWKACPLHEQKPARSHSWVHG